MGRKEITQLLQMIRGRWTAGKTTDVSIVVSDSSGKRDWPKIDWNIWPIKTRL